MPAAGRKTPLPGQRLWRTGAAFFLPESSCLHDSLGIDTFCGEAGTLWRQIDGPLGSWSGWNL